MVSSRDTFEKTWEVKFPTAPSLASAWATR